MNARDIKTLNGNAIAGVRAALKGRVRRAQTSKQIILLQMDGKQGESFNAAEFYQTPGIRSVPTAGMQPIIIPLNGKSANGVAVAMSNGALYVTDLAEGEIAVFNETDGVANSLVLRNGKIAELTCDTFKVKATTMVEIDTPVVKMTHNLEVAENTKTATINVTSTAANASQMAGGLDAQGDVVSGGISLQNHLTTGVQPGPGLSGGPQ